MDLQLLGGRERAALTGSSGRLSRRSARLGRERVTFPPPHRFRRPTWLVPAAATRSPSTLLPWTCIRGQTRRSMEGRAVPAIAKSRLTGCPGRASLVKEVTHLGRPGRTMEREHLGRGRQAVRFGPSTTSRVLHPRSSRIRHRVGS